VRMLRRVGSSCSRALIRSWEGCASCFGHLFLTASRLLGAGPIAVLAHSATFSEAYLFSLAWTPAALSFRRASSSFGFCHLEYQRTPADRLMYRYSSSHSAYVTSLPHLHFRLLKRPLGLYVGSRKMPLRLRGQGR